MSSDDRSNIEIARDVKESGQAYRTEYEGEEFTLDLQTAGAMVEVWEHINESNRAKFNEVPLPVMAHKAWDIIGSYEERTGQSVTKGGV